MARRDGQPDRMSLPRNPAREPTTADLVARSPCQNTGKMLEDKGNPCRRSGEANQRALPDEVLLSAYHCKDEFINRKRSGVEINRHLHDL